jgi:hypothetical protein
VNVEEVKSGLAHINDFEPAMINNRGDLTFGADFLENPKGAISSLVKLGGPAPGGGTFDFAENPWINSAGDVGFGAHVASDPCIDFGVPQSARIFCAESVYVERHGIIESIAHQGDPAPGGGVFNYAFGPQLNSRGDIVFAGDLTASA